MKRIGGSPQPKGFAEIIERMKSAKSQKELNKKQQDEMGRVKHSSKHTNEDGLTNVKPFSFESRPA